MAWISVHEQVQGMKLRELSKKIGCSQKEALGTLVSLWLWGINNATKDGELKGSNKSDIKDALSIGLSIGLSPDKVVDCLIECHWIDHFKGKYILHDWDIWQEQWYKALDRRSYDTRRKREDRKKKSNSCPQDSPPDIPQDSPSENPVQPSPSPSPIEEEEEEERAREGKIFKFFNKNIGMITPFQSETISQHLDEGMEPEMIMAILEDSTGKSEKWTWIKTVLNNSTSQGIKTLEQYEAKKVERQNIKNRGSPAKRSKGEERRAALLRAREIANKANGGVSNDID